MSIAKQIPDAIKRAARSLGYAMWLDTPEAWHGVSVVITARLSLRVRVLMAWAVLRSLPPEHVIAVAETTLPKGSGQPIAPLFNYMDEAAFWADMADPQELEAYCLASFNRMAGPRQAAFLEFIQGRAAA